MRKLNGTVVAVVVALDLVVGGVRAGSAQSNAIGAEIRNGTCAKPSDIVFQLQPPVIAVGDHVGDARGIQAASSFTPAPDTLEDLLGSPAVVTLSSGDTVTACGAIGGVLETDGALGIVVRPTKPDGPSGVAYFRSNGDVSLFVDPGSPSRAPTAEASTAAPAAPVPPIPSSPVSAQVSTTPGTRDHPLPVGTAADVGGGWTVAVTGVVPDASAAVQAENQFNKPPADGAQFFMVTITATYHGDGSSRLPAGNEFKLVGQSSVAYASFDPGCGVIPNAFPTSEVFSGGTIQGNICFQVKTADVASLVLFSEDNVTFDRTKRVWFAVH